jgi:hypothetical protein
MPFTIENLKHIEAAWGAATGARASKLCRFSVAVGRQILEDAGFTARFAVSDLPPPEELDGQHAVWRGAVMTKAQKMNCPFTHGIAAKLLNSYLKERFVCGGDHEHERVKYLHPPIDALLLDALAKADFGGQGNEWRKFHNARWSKFDSIAYQGVIDLMRRSLPEGEPLWKIEEHWRGYW